MEKKLINLEEMVDVLAGPNNLIDLNKEINHYLNKTDEIIVTVKKEDGKYHTKIYIPINDFKK